MTRHDLDKLWMEALHQSVAEGETYVRYHFAALVAAHEREMCAKVCDLEVMDSLDSNDAYHSAKNCAAAIRARGEK